MRLGVLGFEAFPMGVALLEGENNETFLMNGGFGVLMGVGFRRREIELFGLVYFDNFFFFFFL